MYGTTQCDWSSSSWLQGTITPAVIKGQRSHHEQLSRKISEWIKAHPDDYAQAAGEAGPAQSGVKPSVVPAGDSKADKASNTAAGTIQETGSQTASTKTMADHLEDVVQKSGSTRHHLDTHRYEHLAVEYILLNILQWSICC